MKPRADYDDDLILQTGSVHHSKYRSSYSNYGYDIDFVVATGFENAVTAPAQPTRDITFPSYYVTGMPTNEYFSDPTYEHPTSLAAAHTTGIGALLLSNWNQPTANSQNLSQEDVEYLIEIGSDDITYDYNDGLFVEEIAGEGYDDFTGWGLIRADKSLQYLQAPNFHLMHVQYAASGAGTSTLIEEDAEITVETDYCYAGLDAGTYVADVFKVVISTTHSFESDQSIHNISTEHPGYWVLNSMSNLWDYDESTKTTTARNGVSFTSGNTPDATGAELVGYLFDIKEKKHALWTNTTVDKWYPHKNTDQHVVAYALHLSRDWELSYQTPDYTYKAYPNPSTGQLTINANSPTETIESIKILTFDGQLVDEVNNINASQYLYVTKQSLKGMYLVAIQNRKTTHYAKIRFE